MAWITSTSICNNSYHSFLNLKNAVTTMWITPKNNTVWCNWLYIRKIPNFQYIWRHNKPYLVLMLIQLWSFHNNVLSMINPKNLVLLILVIIVLEAIICIFISLCGAGEGWRRSVGPITWEMKKCYLESMSRGISYTK